MKVPSSREYPKKLYIGDVAYRVRIVKTICRQPALLGLCDADKRLIYIKRDQSRLDLLKTFIHELLHALEFEYDIPVKHAHIYKLEHAITDLLLNNF